MPHSPIMGNPSVAGGMFVAENIALPKRSIYGVPQMAMSSIELGSKQAVAMVKRWSRRKEETTMVVVNGDMFGSSMQKTRKTSPIPGVIVRVEPNHGLGLGAFERPFSTISSGSKDFNLTDQIMEIPAFPIPPPRRVNRIKRKPVPQLPDDLLEIMRQPVVRFDTKSSPSSSKSTEARTSATSSPTTTQSSKHSFYANKRATQSVMDISPRIGSLPIFIPPRQSSQMPINEEPQQPRKEPKAWLSSLRSLSYSRTSSLFIPKRTSSHNRTSSGTSTSSSSTSTSDSSSEASSLSDQSPQTPTNETMLYLPSPPKLGSKSWGMKNKSLSNLLHF